MLFNEITTSDTGNTLVPSLSIQSKDGSYFLFSGDNELDDSLSDLDIERKDIPVDSQYLLTLFQQERSACSWMKWASLDHALEKLLQWPLLSVRDLGPETKDSAWRRVRPAERSILLKSTWGLVKAYAVQGFVRGLELGLFTSIHLFIYSMLFYRLVKLIQTGSTHLEEFQASFIGSNQKGIDSLVRLLAGLEVQWLRLILTSPFIIGGLQSISSLWGARRTSSVTLKNYIQTIDTHLQTGGGWLRDGVYEYLPGISSAGFLSLSGKLQKLESLVRWDGRLSSKERTQIFDALCRVALEGKKSTQLNALQSLAKIAHGVGFKDLSRLKEAGYSKEELMTILYTKGKALEMLTTLSPEVKANQRSRFQKIYSLPQRLHRQYLLWWLLGLKTPVWKQQLPAVLLKGTKLTIEFYFFQMIVLSILEAIRCPDKLGFELGFGYPEWATELTTDCFIELIENQFRSVNLSDSVDDLVAQIPLFNLADLDTLELAYKSLTGIDMVKILTAVTKRGAPLTTLYIYDYFADADMEVFTQNYLKTSQINAIRLGCQDIMYPGGEGLTSQGLQYLADVLPDTQLTYLWFCFPNIDNSGIIALAEQLNKTKIDHFYIQSANIDDTAGQVVAQTLAEMPIKRMNLFGSRIGDETVQAMIELIQNNPELADLWIEGDLITDQGAASFAQIIQHSNLDTVGLQSSQITDSGMISLMNSLKELPSLTNGFAIGSQSGEQGIVILAQQLDQTNFWYFELIGYGNLLTANSMRALSSAWPLTQITEFWLIGYQLNNETLALFADGIRASFITVLALDHIILIDSVLPLGPGIRELEALQLSACNLTDDDVIALAPYLPGSAIQEFYLIYNNIGDRGVLALTQVLPFTNVTTLSLVNNNITNIGAQALADIYSSTRLIELRLYGNNVSSNLLAQIESFQWQQYCQDQLCHTNAKYNGYTATLTSRDSSPMRHRPSHHGRNHLNPSRRYGIFDSDVKRESSKKITWGASSSIEVIEDNPLTATTNTTLEHSAGFHTIESLSISDMLALPSPSASEGLAESLLTPAAAGTMIVGIAVLGVLLYKNLTPVRAFVNASFRMLERCFYGSSSSLSSSSNPHSLFALAKAIPDSGRTNTPFKSEPKTSSLVGFNK